MVTEGLAELRLLLNKIILFDLKNSYLRFMTTALKKIISKQDKMPIAEQNAIAALLNDELSWKKSFENSRDELQLLATKL